jgi:hypothetical protein
MNAPTDAAAAWRLYIAIFFAKLHPQQRAARGSQKEQNNQIGANGGSYGCGLYMQQQQHMTNLRLICPLVHPTTKTNELIQAAESSARHAALRLPAVEPKGGGAEAVPGTVLT